MIKLFSAFSGIGAFEKALENLNIDFEIIGFSEIDKYASESYSILHNADKSLNYGDITKIDINTLPDFDLFTWGFLCQDLSVIGTQKGFNGEKSVLFFQGYEILKHKKPAVSIIENVSNLMSKKFDKELNTIIKLLEKIGYKTKILRMNAKEYGIPQNRDRVFIVSMLNKYPHLNIKKEELSFYAKNILEDNADKKYYLSDKQFEAIERKGTAFEGRFKPFLLEDFIIANAINNRTDVPTSNFIKIDKGIRRLTPLECWLLMGWSKEDFSKVSHLSDTQLYRQAGNSIVIQVLEKILDKIYKN
ncbi:DNA (cytosine-5-)-methyltransferase [Brachyspira murdochii]|uniref:DNA (cytosine-5-)-methyltransferase n=1 Tax=Brachyspira murdochii TaxID=84378 RepID=A0ABX5B6V0_9SPIR|nr:DNA (cytosine-5-)-methyltransferase [Brachyspira murdochii]PPS22951.1 hypothetical protein DJ52_01780 [Brachyspira murdochii]